MRVKLYFLFLLLGFLVGSLSAASSAHASDSEEVEAGDDIVQENPDYVGREIGGDLSEGVGDEVPSSKDRNETKAAIEKALASSKKSHRRALRLIKKHRLKITIALALFAFRREIQQALWYLFSTPAGIDPETGEIVRRPVGIISVTGILKLLLFIDVMRRMQGEDGSKVSPLVGLLLAGSRGNPVLGMLLSQLLGPSNTAYVPPVQQHFTFERINERYKKDGMALKKAMTPSGESKRTISAGNTTTIMQLFSSRAASTNVSSFNGTVVMLDMTGLDTSVRQMAVLRDEISFLLRECRSILLDQSGDKAEIEIVVLLESPGGSAADYGLAAQQVLRLRNEGIKVTICVDKVAASGGYMIACTSSPGRLFAAPFAMLGSIGVIGQALNIHKALHGWGVEGLVFRGGKDKAPVGLLGKVTPEGIAKVQDMVDSTHRAFMRHVADYRPVVAERIEEIATGEVWLGYDALDLGLIDRIVTSDEYIGERLSDGARVLKLVHIVRSRSLFSPPSTSASLVESPKLNGPISWIPFLGDFQAFLQRVSEAYKICC